MRKLLIAIVLSALLFSGAAAYFLYVQVFGTNIKPLKEDSIILIPTGATFETVIDTLTQNLEIRKIKSFVWVAEKKRYPQHIKPGRYIVSGEMNNAALVNMLRSGNQAPVRLTFSNIRTLPQLAARIGRVIEADSLKIIDFLSDDRNYSADGFRRETIISVFIPDTYEFFWNTDPRGLYERMLREYRKFWNDDRLQKARAAGLEPLEVSILASIIDDEVSKKDEKPRIAGVYLNRLKRGIPLQACPTIKYALNDFTITRVLYVHLSVDSPYNTYKYKGLPPGPVGCPSKEGIEAVLNAEKHDYLYFAARADFSGYHNFSRTLAEHNRYANQYQRELDKRRIFK